MCFLKMFLVYDGSSRWNNSIDQTVCVGNVIRDARSVLLHRRFE